MNEIEQDLCTAIDMWNERVSLLIASREFQHEIIKKKISAEIRAIRRCKRDVKIILEKIRAGNK